MHKGLVICFYFKCHELICLFLTILQFAFFKLLIKIFITMKSLNKLFLLLFIISLAHTGQILSGDLFVDYANAGSMTKLSFSFMLTNTIYQKDYIQVSMPFPFHASLVPAYPATQGLSLPTGLVLTYQLVDGSSNVLPTVYTGQILTQTIDSSNYFIRFYDTTKKNFISILANQWYYVTFDIQDSLALQYQKSNSILQIQISTVSSVWANAMVYDDNLAFNFFQLSSTPSQSITLVASPFNYGNAGGYLLIQNSYYLNLDVSMNLSSYLFNQNIVLKFLIGTQNSFLWNGICQSVAKTNAPKVAMLNSSLYTCQIDLIENVINVVLTPAALKLQTNYRFTANIINPPLVFPSVNIEVRAVKQKSGVILGYGVHTAALSTNPLYVTYQQIFLGWGLRPDALLPFNVMVFRGNSATPTYMPYNSLSLKFSISQTTSPDIELKIVIKIPSQNTAFVLQNGFTNNLPAAPNKIVKCVVENADTGSIRQIGCTGIGSMSAGIVYQVGWKMFFPYDNYASSIDCTKFGTLTVYTTKKISVTDNAFFLGRSNQYLSYLSTSPDFYVLGRNVSYITYMKTFLNLNLVVLSQDFQEFLSTPQNIFVTNRPLNYANKQFQDVYVIVQNLDFMNYISLFTDIFIAARLKADTDIVNGYDANPLIAQTTPKNTLSIATNNTQDWTDFVTNLNPLVSSTTATSGFVAGTGLKQNAGTQQSLIFSLNAPYSTVTGTVSSAGSITNNWGMMIMMSQKIAYDNTSTVTLSQPTNTLSKSVTTNFYNGSYNNYTLITLRASTPAQIQTNFPISPTKTNFGIYPFTIDGFSSIYADSDNYDIMIATVDGIDGPLNKLSYNSFFLINGFSIVDTAISTLNMGFMNYLSSTTLDGSKVPTFLRIKGSISGTTNFDSLSIFFDKLTPFFSNAYTGDVYCTSTDGTPFCQYYDGHINTNNPSVQNYQSMSRFDIKLTAPATSFNIFIPVKIAQTQTKVSFYVGYQKKDPTTNVVSLAFVQSFANTSITQAYPGSLSGTYGPVVSSSNIGSTITSMQLKANSPSAGIAVNTANSIGGGFTYFSSFDYIGSSTITGWSTIGTCFKSYYLYYYTNYADYMATISPTFQYAYDKMKGIICTTDTSNTGITTAILTISTGVLPSKWGKSLPGYGAYSQNTGQLLYINKNYMTVTNDLVISTPVALPLAGPLLTKSVGEFIIPLQASLDGNVQVLISGNPASTNIPYLSSALGTCCVYYMGSKMPIGCTYVPSPTQLQYTLIINQEGLLPKGGNFSIVHYGLTTNSSYSTVNIDLVVYSLLNNPSPVATDLIFKQLAISFPWNATAYSSALNMGSFTQWTSNKATVSSFNFSFTLISKGLYRTNRIRFNLGQFAVDNNASSVTPICKVYNYDTSGSLTFSHDWNAIDSSQGLSSLQIWPDGQLMSSNLTYTIACTNFLSTSSPNPTSISAKVVNMSSDLTGQLSSATTITLPVLSSVSTTAQISLSKKFTIPSTVMQMIFSIVSPGITTDSILYLNFPSYYRDGLGSDIKCYSTNQIYCVITGRQLKIRYIGTYSAGTSFTITVVGVTKNINYNSGTFSFAIDNDDNPSTILTSGTFVDSVSSSASSVQNFPTFPIFSLTQSSAYLREEDVTITANFYLPTTLGSVSVGQSLFMIFPPIYFDVLRFITPTCTLNLLGNTLKNYISSCSVYGMRLKMVFLDSLVLGSTYSLILTGIINPTNPSSKVYKYSFEISSSDGTSIVAKSYSPNGNYDMPIFVVNPIRKSLNYYTASSGLITNLVSMSNIQSQQVYISPALDYVHSVYDRNAYLTPLSNLYTQPSNIDLTAGANPFPIRFTSLTSGVNYVYFTKTGDGSYYSNLPPLILTTNKNYFTAVSFVETQFKLPVNVVGTNYTISITLPSNLYPISQVDMNISLSSAVGISLRVNPTVVQFYPTKIVAYINLYINDATLWTVGRTTNLVITPQGSTFASGATIPLTAVAASSNVPTLTIATLSKTQKSITFNVNCSQQGRLIYHVSRYFAYNTTACSMNISSIQNWSSQTSIDGLRVSQTYYSCDDQINIVNIVTPNSTQTLTISSLLGSTAYTIQAYCQTQSNVNSLLSTTQFTTQSNGGVLNYMSFSFESILSTSQKIKLVCALALYFNLNYERVSTWDGYYCSQLLNRRLLISQAQPQLQNVQQQTKSIRQLTTAVYQTVVYFGINNDMLTDSTRALILTQSSLTTLKSQLNTNVTGLPNLVSYSTDVLSYIGPNDLANTNFQIGLGPNYVFLSGITLSHNGLIYVIIGDANLWTRDPLISQIKKGSGPDGLPPVDFRVLAYRTTDASSSNMVWTGLGSSTYKIYIMASDDNPFDTANFGQIRSYTISKQVPSWQLMTKVCMSLMGLIMLLML